MIEPALRKEGYENIFSANNITTVEKAVYISVFIIIESALISFNSSSAYLFVAIGTSVYSLF